MNPEDAYEKSKDSGYDKATMRILLDSVLEMWRHSSENSQQLEQKIAELEQQLDEGSKEEQRLIELNSTIVALLKSLF